MSFISGLLPGQGEGGYFANGEISKHFSKCKLVGNEVGGPSSNTPTSMKRLSRPRAR